MFAPPQPSLASTQGGESEKQYSVELLQILQQLTPPTSELNASLYSVLRDVRDNQE